MSPVGVSVSVHNSFCEIIGEKGKWEKEDRPNVSRNEQIVGVLFVYTSASNSSNEMEFNIKVGS